MKFFNYTILIVLLIFINANCSKRHEEDSLIRFRSLKNRIEGTWEMQKIIINSNDSSFLINNSINPFYAIYSIKIYDKTNTHLFGDLEIETIKRDYKVGKERGLKVKILRDNSTNSQYEIKFYANQWDSIPEIFPHGLINHFFEEYHLQKIIQDWDITKLTNKDLHINVTNYNNGVYYEIQFNKKKK
jgi:hypothetical protein